MEVGQRVSINYELLIKREEHLLHQGNQSSRLADLIKQYEFSPKRSERLTPDQIILYFVALILSGRYIELKFAVKRNQVLLLNQQHILYLQIAEFAIDKKFQKLITKVKSIKHQFSYLLIKSVKAYILYCLSKNFITIGYQLLKNNYDITEEDLLQNQCQILENQENIKKQYQWYDPSKQISTPIVKQDENEEKKEDINEDQRQIAKMQENIIRQKQIDDIKQKQMKEIEKKKEKKYQKSQIKNNSQKYVMLKNCKKMQNDNLGQLMRLRVRQLSAMTENIIKKN